MHCCWPDPSQHAVNYDFTSTFAVMTDMQVHGLIVFNFSGMYNNKLYYTTCGSACECLPHCTNIVSIYIYIYIYICIYTHHYTYVYLFICTVQVNACMHTICLYIILCIVLYALPWLSALLCVCHSVRLCLSSCPGLRVHSASN